MSEVQRATLTETGKGEIAVGYVHGEFVLGEFMGSMLAFREFDWRNRHSCIASIGMKGACIADNRNRVVRWFLDQAVAADWLLFIDTDQAFGREAVYQLLDSADPILRPVVSALIFGNVDLFTDSGDPGGPIWAPNWMKYNPGGYPRLVLEFTTSLQEVDAVDMGFCLIHRSVLEAMRSKYEAEDNWPWFGHDLALGPAGVRVRLGEDFTFCARARKLGFSVWGNGGVIVDHIKSRRENLSTFVERYRPDITKADGS
jgi:hypothetical protein